MRIFHQLEEIRGAVSNPAVTVGSFDGVHAGHRAILQILQETAQKIGGESVVVTFDPHPRKMLHPEDENLKLLNSPEEKIYLLEQIGVDNLLILPFTPEFSQLDFEAFARRYLLEGIGAKAIVMGYNHHFGHNRKGNRDYLEKLRDEFQFEMIQLPRQAVGNKNVSSTVLRRLIRSGDLEHVRELLGEPYFFIAKTGTCGMLQYDEPAKLFPPEGTYPVAVDDGTESFDANLLITKDESGLSLPRVSRNRPGQKLIVRFKDPIRHTDAE